MTAMNSRELDSFIGELVRFYGVERAIYVLSRTIQFSDWDSRFGQAVLDRAGQTDFPDARTPRDENHVAQIEKWGACVPLLGFQRGGMKRKIDPRYRKNRKSAGFFYVKQGKSPQASLSFQRGLAARDHRSEAIAFK